MFSEGVEVGCSGSFTKGSSSGFYDDCQGKRMKYGVKCVREVDHGKNDTGQDKKTTEHT